MPPKKKTNIHNAINAIDQRKRLDQLNERLDRLLTGLIKDNHNLELRIKDLQHQERLAELQHQQLLREHQRALAELKQRFSP